MMFKKLGAILLDWVAYAAISTGAVVAIMTISAGLAKGIVERDMTAGEPLFYVGAAAITAAALIAAIKDNTDG